MKKILTFILCFSAICTAHGQVKIGIEMGVNASNYINNTGPNGIVQYDIPQGTTVKYGFRGGAVIDIPFNQHVFLQPGLLYVMNGCKYGSGFYSGGWEVNTLQIPLNLLFKFWTKGKTRPFLGAGLYLAYNLSGTNDFTAPPSSLNIGDNLKPFDMGFALNIGYETPLGLFLRLHYQKGFFNLEPSQLQNYGITSYNYGATIGYLFGGKKKHKKALAESEQQFKRAS